MDHGAASEDQTSSIWSILPSFDPSADDPREYVDKVKFLHSICPAKDKAMLAPRLAMLMKGTAWAQIKAMDTTKLADPEQGVSVLLQAVATWEEAAELQTYDKFEKAIYKVSQSSDETNMSYVNRMNVSFLDLGDVNLKDMKAFVLLRQSSLTPDDKRKVITMTGGKLEAEKIEKAMRSLSTKEDTEEAHHVADYEEPMDEETILQAMVDGGDEDAQVFADFEDQLVEICQESPELSLCFSAYAEARGRLRDKIKSRGFWPPKEKGKMNRKGFGGFGRKGGGKRRQSLADRIAASHCRICGQKRHWKWECPKKGSGTTSSTSADVNVALEVQSSSFSEEIAHEIPDHGTVLSLNDLLRESQDMQQGSCGESPSLESLEFLKREPLGNEEFIFVTVAGRNSQTHGNIAQFLNTEKLGKRLRSVLCRSGIRTENAAESVLSAEFKWLINEIPTKCRSLFGVIVMAHSKGMSSKGGSPMMMTGHEELPFPEDPELNYASPAQVQIRCSAGITSLHQWGEQIFPEGKYVGETFKKVFEEDGKYSAFMKNHCHLTNAWALSFQNYVPGDSNASDANAKGQDGRKAQGNLDLASGRLQCGLGADGRSIIRSGIPTEEGVEPRSNGKSRHECDQGRGEGTTAAHQDCHLAAGDRSSEKATYTLEGPASVAPASNQGESNNMVSTSGDFNVELCQQELDRLSAQIQQNLDVMLALSWEVNALRDESPSSGPLTSSFMFQESK
eukprot:s270_g13.t1